MYRIIFFMILCIELHSQESADTAAYTINLDDYVITAQYEPTHYKNSVHKVSLIQKATIEKIGAVTLEQALVLSPSVRLREDPILGTSIRMRGIEASNVAILVDGIPAIGRNNGSIDLSQISLQNVERIEIVEGPLSSIYGNNAAGGVINIITKKSQVDRWNFSINNQIESIGQRNHSANIGYQGGGLNLSLHGRYFNYNQFPSDSLRLLDKVELLDGTTISQARYPFNPKTQKSYGAFMRYNFDEDNFLLAKYDRNLENVSDYGVVKRPQFNPYGNDSFYETEREDVSLNYTGKVKNDFFIKSQFAYNDYNRVRDDKRYYIDSMTFDPALQFSDSIRFDQVFGRSSLNYTGFSEWVIGGGLNFTRESGEGDRILNRENQDSLKASFTEMAYFTDVRYKGFSNVELSISNRYTTHSTYSYAFTSAFQAKFDLSKKTTIRSSIAQGYRSPSLKELYLEFIDINHHIIGNTDLKPERSIDFQTTLSFQANDQMQFELNAYYTKIKDRIDLFQYESLKFQYDNVNQYRVYGFQPSIQYNQFGLNINSNFSLGYWATNIELEDAPQFGRVLDWNTTFSYTVPMVNVTFLANHRYVGSQPIYRLRDEALKIDHIEDYHLVDLSASRSFWKDKINLLVGARNVFNTKSARISGQSSGGAHSSGARNNISIGRSLFVTLQIDINKK